MVCFSIGIDHEKTERFEPGSAYLVPSCSTSTVQLSYMLCFRILESVHSGFTISFNSSYLIDGFGVLIERIPWWAYLTLFFTGLQFIVQGAFGVCSPFVRSPNYRLTIIQVSLEMAVSPNSVHSTRIFHILGYPVRCRIRCEPVLIFIICCKYLLMCYFPF